MSESGIISPGSSRKGILVIHGGGNNSPWLFEWFRCACANKIVVIPSACAENELEKRTNAYRKASVTVVHTQDREEANSDEFLKHLRNANGVWITGGRQWRLAKYYLGTGVEREIKALLERGGIVAGSSAGASIQASYLVRGDEQDDTTKIMVPPYEDGFGLLPNSAIDQHVNTRNRHFDLQQVLAVYPDILGIGIYEDTAIVVKEDIFEVQGLGKIVIHDRMKTPYFLSVGQRFNWRERSVV